MHKVALTLHKGGRATTFHSDGTAENLHISGTAKIYSEVEHNRLFIQAETP